MTETTVVTTTTSQNGVSTQTETTTVIVPFPGQMAPGVCANKFSTSFDGAFVGMWDVESMTNQWATNNKV